MTSFLVVVATKMVVEKKTGKVVWRSQKQVVTFFGRGRDQFGPKKLVATFWSGATKEFTTKIKSAQNTLPNDAWVAITSTIMKTLEYPMAALTITKQGWDEIMKPLLHFCLPVAGYSQNFPRAVIFVPSEQGGKGLMHPWYNQELTHLETFWEELASETHTGEFFTTSMEALRLELSYPTSLMSVPFDRMAGCATNSWLTSLWETCNKWNIDIKSIAPELKKGLRV